MPPSDQDIPRRISFVRLGLVILVLVGLGTLIWAIFFRTSPTNQGTVATNTPPTSQTSKTPAPKPKQPSSSQQKSSPSTGTGSSPTTQNNADNGSTSPTPNPTPSSSQPSSSPSAPSSSSSAGSASGTQQLANTGPGDTVALFAGVTAVAGFVHFVYTRRRYNSKA